MIALLYPWRIPGSRRPRHRQAVTRPIAEALETRSLLAGSISANIAGLTPPVVSMTLPQPAGSGVQDVSLILRASKDDPQLAIDSASGKILHKVEITLSDGHNGQDTIHLRNALITSFQVMPGSNDQAPVIALTLEGQTAHTGSISANIDGVTPAVITLTIPQPPTSGALDVSLLAKVSNGTPKLFTDAAIGKIIQAVDITLDQIGNSHSETISLTNVVISSIQLVGGGDVPNVEITLVAQSETIRKS
jgi:type VI protein secretion system component Hcp